MSTLPALAATSPVDEVEESTRGMFLTMTVADQLFGIPVLAVQDILSTQRITRVPLAPPEVLGSLNLRGRIVTAIDVRTRLGIPAPTEKPDEEENMSVVVDHDGELYSLVIDKVGEVMSLPETDYEQKPATLDPRWQEVSSGIYRLKDRLLVVLDVASLLRLDKTRAL